MPNGRPGDNPYTDIVLHGYDVYGEGIDDKVRQIHENAGAEALEHISFWEYGWNPPPDEMQELKEEVERVWRETCKK